jgi:outer membrane receptor protein involved in Fe transport
MSTPLRDIGRMSSAMVDPLLVERIEVINGASAIEGLGGSGGMINYITKTPTTEGVVNTVQTAMETQFHSDYIGWKATGLTMVKKQNLDFLLSVGTQSRPMYYDPRGNLGSSIRMMRSFLLAISSSTMNCGMFPNPKPARKKACRAPISASRQVFFENTP